jgi:hypothetical protein
VEERRGARGVKQRHLEVEPPRPPPSEPPVPPPEEPPRPAPAQPPADRPIPPSNRGLLERQLRWHRERAKFESGRGAGEETK